MTKSLFLIDGHALVYRAFYAIEGLTAPDGRPTGAVYGFLRMLLATLSAHHPDHLVAVFDAPGKTFRHEAFPEYKATRKPAPPELHEQVPLIQQFMKAYRIPIATKEGYEADDLIGSLARQGAERDMDVVIVTGDKDCAQLLNERVRMFDPKKEAFTTVEEFQKKKGITPAQLPDVMGLWGDSSDNIPGVPGIGEKIGVELIAKYGSLESLLENAGEIKGKRGEKLRENAEIARLSKRLATIDTAAPAALDLESSKRRDPDKGELIALLEDLGFQSLLNEIDDSRPPRDERHDYVLVDTLDKFDAFFRALADEKRFAFDTETTSLDPLRGELVGMSFSWAAQSAYYLPFKAPGGEAVLGEKELRRVAKILEGPDYGKTGQNLKYDALALKRAGVELDGIAFDTLLCGSLLQGHLRQHDLDTLALRYLDYTKIPTKELLGSGRKQVTMDAVPVKKVCEYACENADIVWRLQERMRAEIAGTRNEAILREMELPLSRVLTIMQQTGIRVDADLLATQSAEMGELLADLTAEIHALAGHEFNIASTKQLQQVLFDEMNLPVIRKTKTGASTDEAVLTTLAREHEIAARLLDYRMYSKLKNTYLDTLPELVHPETGRIHATFSQTSTATGRLASNNPNLQNIPVRSERGRAIRAAFVPEDGWRMLAADYSQVELRMLAHFSEDERLCRAFAEGRDIHRVVAAQVEGVDEDEVTPAQRSAAKAVNFGILYGQGPHGLSQQTGMSQGQARLFIESYFEQFPQVREFIDQTVAAAHETGYVETVRGRRRVIPELQSNNKTKRARGEREAVNTVVQGSAADLIKTAMIDLRARMRNETPLARMLLQIHDELVFETPPEEIDTLETIVREAMENAMVLAVPLTVDIGRGKNWLEVK